MPSALRLREGFPLFGRTAVRPYKKNMILNGITDKEDWLPALLLLLAKPGFLNPIFLSHHFIMLRPGTVFADIATWRDLSQPCVRRCFPAHCVIKLLFSDDGEPCLM
ncbi:hypothetical protein LH53_05940 [Mesotoga sp. TolDC]|nr:hypothetical protein LH53_05940 [Mesotoga sp. TolDC]